MAASIAATMCLAPKSYMATVSDWRVPARNVCRVGQPASGLAWQSSVIGPRAATRARSGGSRYCRPAAAARVASATAGMSPGSRRSGSGGRAASCADGTAVGGKWRSCWAGVAGATSTGTPSSSGSIGRLPSAAGSPLRRTVTTTAGVSVIQPPVNLNPGRTSTTFGSAASRSRCRSAADRAAPTATCRAAR